MNTLIDVAVADGHFKTLAKALTAAGLIDTLKGEGPFTVFAPTDDAFAKLPVGTVDGLLKDIPKLTTILKYHVLEGKVAAADLMKLDGKTATMLNGADLKVSTTGAPIAVSIARRSGFARQRCGPLQIGPVFLCSSLS